MKTAIITQARMSSTRLPGKVLMRIGNRSLLEIHCARAAHSQLPIIVATSTERSDNPISQICQKHHIPCFRGELYNVLSRFYHCAKRYKINTIIRITSDCPLIDGSLIQKGLTLFNKEKSDYLSNTINRTFPTGFDFEIFTIDALSQAFSNATLDYEKEHVTPYIWKTHPHRFIIRQLTQQHNKSQYRLTVDERADFELITKLIIDFDAENKNHQQITAILEANPHLVLINQSVRQKIDES